MVTITSALMAADADMKTDTSAFMEIFALMNASASTTRTMTAITPTEVPRNLQWMLRALKPVNFARTVSVFQHTTTHLRLETDHALAIEWDPECSLLFIGTLNVN